MLEFTDWAKDILGRADAAARRFNPEVVIRLARKNGEVQAVLAESPAEGDVTFELPSMTLYAEKDLSGLVDVEEPHDRLVLRPAGSRPNPREH